MNKKIISIVIISIFLLTGLTSLSVAKIETINGIEKNKNDEIQKINNEELATISLDIKGGIWYTIIVKNTGLGTAYLEDIHVIVKRKSRTLDDYTESFDGSTATLEPQGKIQCVPYLHVIFFGIGPIEITAEVTGLNFPKATVTEKGFSFISRTFFL